MSTGNRIFERSKCPYPKRQKVREGNIILLNVSNYLPVYTVWHPKWPVILYCLQNRQWLFQIVFFWVLISFTLLGGYWRFRGTCNLRAEGRGAAYFSKTFAIQCQNTRRHIHEIIISYNNSLNLTFTVNVWFVLIKWMLYNETCRGLEHSQFQPKYGSRWFFRNVCNSLSEDTTSHPAWEKPSYTPTWKPSISNRKCAWNNFNSNQQERKRGDGEFTAVCLPDLTCRHIKQTGPYP